MNISGDCTARQMKGLNAAKPPETRGGRTHSHGLVFGTEAKNLLFVFLQFGLQLVLQHVFDQRLHALR